MLKATVSGKSQSPFHQLKVLANVATIRKEDELAINAINNPEANSVYFQEILAKLAKISVSSNLNEKFKDLARQILSPFEANPFKFNFCKSNKLFKLKDDSEARIVLTKCGSPYRK